MFPISIFLSMPSKVYIKYVSFFSLTRLLPGMTPCTVPLHQRRLPRSTQILHQLLPRSTLLLHQLRPRSTLLLHRLRPQPPSTQQITRSISDRKITLRIIQVKKKYTKAMVNGHLKNCFKTL